MQLRYLFGLESSGPESSTEWANPEIQKSRLIRAVNTSAILALLLLEVLRLLQGSRVSVTDGIILSGAAAFFLSSFFLFKGWLNAAIVFNVSVTWCVATLMLFTGQGIYDTAVSVYIIIILMSALLSGSRLVLAFSILSIIIIWTVGVLQMTGALPVQVDTIDGVMRDHTIVLLMTAVLTTIYVRNHQRALNQIKRYVREKEEAENHLRDSEEKYRNIILHMQDVYYRADAEGKLLMISPSGAALLGWDSPLDMIGLPIAESFYYNPSDREYLMTKLLAEGSVEHFDVLLKRKDGSAVYVSTNAHVVRNPDGSFRFIEGTFRDITRLVQAEKRWKESEERFRNIVETVPDAIFIVGERGIINEANHAAEEQTGYTRAELIGLHISKIASVSNQPEIAGMFAAHRAAPHFYEGVHLRKDGSEVFVEVGLRYITWDDRKYMLGISRDISERKRAQLALEESERTYREAIEAIGGVPYKDSMSPREYLFIGDGIEKMTGYSAAEMTPALLNSRITESIPRGDLSGLAIIEALEKIDSGKTNVWKCDLRLQTRENETKWILDSAVIRRENGVNAGSIGILQDVTERVKAEEELRIAKEKAEEINKLKSVFFANMSHELRTPLMGIMGYADYLLPALHSPEHRHAVETITKSSQRLLRTIQQILDISKLDADKVLPVIGPVEIPRLMRDCVEAVREAAVRKGLRLMYIPPEEEIVALADRHLLQAVFSQLLDNAVKFTETGSVTVTVKSEDGETAVKVADTGIGIGRESIQMIFEDFRQESEGMSRSFEGTGLGLSIARKYVDLMKGSITVESELGKGTAFTVCLASAGGAFSGAPAESEPKITSGAAGKKLLLVENDEINLRVIQSYLDGVYDYDVVARGVDALRKAETTAYDAVLLDINLGTGLTGIEVAKKLLQNEHYRSVPLIAVTAFAMEGDREEFLREGCTHYIAKPFSRRELLKLLQAVV